MAKVFDQAPNETDQANGADTDDVGPEKPRRFRDIDVANHLVYGWQAALRYTPNNNCDQAGTTDNARCRATPVDREVPLLVALIQAVQTGHISRRTFFANLQRGEIIASDTAFEDEQVEIKAELPVTTARSAA